MGERIRVVVLGDGTNRQANTQPTFSVGLHQDSIYIRVKFVTYSL